MVYIVEREDTWEATFEVTSIQGVHSVDVLVYYWEKYDEESGNEFGTRTEIRTAKINLTEKSTLESDDTALAEQLTVQAREIFNTTYGAIELWDKKKFEACVSDCVNKP